MKAFLVGVLSLGAVAFASSAWADHHHDSGGSSGGHESHSSSHDSGGHESHSSGSMSFHSSGGSHDSGGHHDFGHHDSIHVTSHHTSFGHSHGVHVSVHGGGVHGGYHGHLSLVHYHHVFRAPHRYRIGFWHGPRGFAYRRFGIGERIPGILLVSTYFLSDYYNYGLEEPDDGFVWVRDGYDAVLVDQYSGEVVEVEYDVFY